jgi:hypothetical protein
MATSIGSSPASLLPFADHIRPRMRKKVRYYPHLSACGNSDEETKFSLTTLLLFFLRAQVNTLPSLISAIFASTT